MQEPCDNHELVILWAELEFLEFSWQHVKCHVRHFKRVVEAVILARAFTKALARIRALQELDQNLQHFNSVLRNSFFRRKL